LPSRIPAMRRAGSSELFFGPDGPLMAIELMDRHKLDKMQQGRVGRSRRRDGLGGPAWNRKSCLFVGDDKAVRASDAAKMLRGSRHAKAKAVSVRTVLARTLTIGVLLYSPYALAQISGKLGKRRRFDRFTDDDRHRFRSGPHPSTRHQQSWNRQLVRSDGQRDRRRQRGTERQPAYRYRDPERKFQDRFEDQRHLPGC